MKALFIAIFITAFLTVFHSLNQYGVVAWPRCEISNCYDMIGCYFPEEKALDQACKNPKCTRLAQLEKNNLFRNGMLSGSGWG